jgi:hypothetical protein
LCPTVLGATPGAVVPVTGSSRSTEQRQGVTLPSRCFVRKCEARGEGSSWTWFWVARREGRGDWSEASTAREAIRKATLLPPRKAVAWLLDAASEAERQIID